MAIHAILDNVIALLPLHTNQPRRRPNKNILSFRNCSWRSKDNGARQCTSHSDLRIISEYDRVHQDTGRTWDRSLHNLSFPLQWCINWLSSREHTSSLDDVRCPVCLFNFSSHHHNACARRTSNQILRVVTCPREHPIPPFTCHRRRRIAQHRYQASVYKRQVEKHTTHIAHLSPDKHIFDALVRKNYCGIVNSQPDMLRPVMHLPRQRP